VAAPNSRNKKVLSDYQKRRRQELGLELDEEVSVDSQLMRLETDIRRLKVEFDIFFNGASKQPPYDTRNRVETMFSRLGDDRSLTYAQRYKMNSLNARFASFRDMWRRAMQNREEGRDFVTVARAKLAAMREEADAAIVARKAAANGSAVAVSEPAKAVEMTNAPSINGGPVAQPAPIAPTMNGGPVAQPAPTVPTPLAPPKPVPPPVMPPPAKPAAQAATGSGNTGPLRKIIPPDAPPPVAAQTGSPSPDRRDGDRRESDRRAPELRPLPYGRRALDPRPGFGESEPAKATPPASQVTRPPNQATPPARQTAPPARQTAPPAPPARQTAPPVNQAAPPKREPPPFPVPQPAAPRPAAAATPNPPPPSPVAAKPAPAPGARKVTASREMASFTFTNPRQEPKEVQALLKEMSKARQRCGESQDDLIPSRFGHMLALRADTLRKTAGCKTVVFSVVIEDGHVNLTARAGE
jgi:hypothetical protein